MKFEWVPIDRWSSRLKVPGGWVLQRVGSFNRKWFGIINVNHATQGYIFIPDPKHEWEPKV